MLATYDPERQAVLARDRPGRAGGRGDGDARHGALMHFRLWCCKVVYNYSMPTRQRQIGFRLPDDLASAMVAVKQQDGIPQSEQVRRALREWLEKRGALKRAGRKEKVR